jgi:hypothetical protein
MGYIYVVRYYMIIGTMVINLLLEMFPQASIPWVYRALHAWLQVILILLPVRVDFFKKVSFMRAS